VFEPDDLLRTGIASARAPAVHGALSYRAQSSGPGKPNTAANVRRCPTPSPCSTPTAPRRNAQLLPSGRSLTNVDSLFGQFGNAQLLPSGRSLTNVDSFFGQFGAATAGRIEPGLPFAVGSPACGFRTDTNGENSLDGRGPQAQKQKEGNLPKAGRDREPVCEAPLHAVREEPGPASGGRAPAV
jgi:hypothetical protein